MNDKTLEISLAVGVCTWVIKQLFDIIKRKTDNVKNTCNKDELILQGLEDVKASVSRADLSNHYLSEQHERITEVLTNIIVAQKGMVAVTKSTNAKADIIKDNVLIIKNELQK